MDIEERIVNLISGANLETLKYWVDNNLSLVQNLDSGERVLFNIIAPILKEIDIDANKVMFLLQKSRPDIYNIVTIDWISKQVAELNGKV